MAERSELPAFVRKRRILFDEKNAGAQRRRAGVAFMEAGLYDDALEFFARCNAREHVREIADASRRECNVPVFLRAKVVLGEKPDAVELEDLAEKAVERGRASMAALAYEKAGLHDKAAEVRDEVFGTERPPAEEGAEMDGKAV